ncbi:MAG: hypothetical protein AAF456_20845 [Planctomycetota bacterium]
MAQKTYRMVTRAPDGSVRTRDFDSLDEIEKSYQQVGIDDCSTDLSLRGMPVFRGLIGPIPEGKGIVRYESPEVFEALTKEWSQKKTRRRRRKSVPAPMGLQFGAGAQTPTPIPGEFA